MPAETALKIIDIGQLIRNIEFSKIKDGYKITRAEQLGEYGLGMLDLIAENGEKVELHVTEGFESFFGGAKKKLARDKKTYAELHPDDKRRVECYLNDTEVNVTETEVQNG